jgi:hypothetical protein
MSLDVYETQGQDEAFICYSLLYTSGVTNLSGNIALFS